MRMLPNRFWKADARVIKKQRAELAHLSPPVKGLFVQARSAVSDAQTASIVTNFYVDDDRLSVRAGFRKVATQSGGGPVAHLIPHYGPPDAMLSAGGDKVYNASTGALLGSGFSSDAWHWTAFANLAQDKYTVMVNGGDGVISWDGGFVSKGPSAAITAITKANPAVCTVAAADIAKFHNGDYIFLSGFTGDFAKVNGTRLIASVNSPVNTFQLVGVDTSTATSSYTSGASAYVQGSFIKENVTAPVGNTWLDPNDLAIVVAHQNRLFFADESKLAVYYLPLQQKAGELGVLPLNAIFKKGGTIKAMATWSVDGGMGMDDQLVIFTSNGEAAIYSGVDPASDFTLVGAYRFSPPMSKWCTAQYGGELYVQIATGVTPMTTMIKAGRENREVVDESVVSIFRDASVSYLANPGWELFFNPNSGRLFANIPKGGGVYDQMVRNMPKPVWSVFKDVPARCWGWSEPYVYFGDDLGNIYQMHPLIQSDDGRPINVDVQLMWSQFKTVAQKQFKMLLPYIVTNGYPRPKVDIIVDYEDKLPLNQPEITVGSLGDATWDIAPWDTSDWVTASRAYNNWTGIAALGRVGAVRLTCAVQDCTFAVTGFDVLFEQGSVFG